MVLPRAGRDSDSALLGFYHDDFQASAGWLTPWTTLPAVLGLLCVALAALVVRRRFPLFAFAVLFFLAGHLLESTVFPLELVFEHRNYLPSIAPSSPWPTSRTRSACRPEAGAWPHR